MLSKVETAISQGKALPDPKDCHDGRAMSIAALLRKAGAKYWSDSVHGASILRVIDTMIDFIGEQRPLSDLNLDLIDDLVANWQTKGNSNATINRKLSVLSKSMTFAHDRGLIDHKPRIEWKKEGKGRIRFMTEAEETSLYSIATQMGYIAERDTYMFLVDTGMRVGELSSLRLDDLQGNRLTIWETKADHPRTIVLTKRALEIFRRYKGNMNEPYQRLYSHWNHIKVAMGLEHDEQFIPHCLRHTCASRLVQRGVPLLVVQEWLGHKDIQMTMRYAHLCPSNMDEAVKVLEPSATRCVAV
jgi:integrase